MRIIIQVNVITIYIPYWLWITFENELTNTCKTMNKTITINKY